VSAKAIERRWQVLDTFIEGVASLFSSIDDVGQRTPMHGHMGVVAIYAGAQRELRYVKPAATADVGQERSAAAAIPLAEAPDVLRATRCIQIEPDPVHT
jgi:hypothetical protein